MITIPLRCSEQDLINTTKDWIRKAAKEGFDTASGDFANHGIDSCWTQELFHQITNDHFDEGEACVITTPDSHSDLRVDVYKFDDGSGYAVEHDLALNDKVSDFTLQIEFIKFGDGFHMFFRDIHVM